MEDKRDLGGDAEDDGLGVGDLPDLRCDLTLDGVALLLPLGGGVDFGEDVVLDVLWEGEGWVTQSEFVEQGSAWASTGFASPKVAW